jgi:cellulose synthase (UDP-forming)
MTSAPSSHEKLAGSVSGRMLTSLYTPQQKRIYLALSVAWLACLLWFWVWWLHPAHFVGLIPFLFATIPLIWIYGLQAFFVYVMLQAARTSAPDPLPGQWRVAMIVTKTPSEPFAILQKTLQAMLDQDYPHDTWLADEDPSDETRAWCAQNGVRISTRKGVEAYHQTVWPRRTRCKEGNLAYFYDTWGYANYDIVSQLDADHVPSPTYLREMVRPFADPAVGYVSAPSICAANAESSWAARTRLHTEAAFHGLFQTGYTRIFAPMCIGSHYAVRTVALQQAGGLGPELAEDHSTTMLMNAAGWRGVHAIDAIAIGDGPVSVADLVTQEFQWSRSLLSLLLQHTGRYLAKLPPRLKFLFVFCQLWYPLFAATSAMLYLAPVVALAFDLRFANVTYPEFLLHAAPAPIVLTIIAVFMRRHGFFRPYDAPVISWEKALFLTLQWPWNLWGCLMAIRDKFTGSFVDFRITPKGSDVQQTLPTKILAVYALLALGAALPVVLSDRLAEANGFLLLALLNAAMYGTLVVVIVVRHLSDGGVRAFQPLRKTAFQVAASASVCGAVLAGLMTRGIEGMHALAYGLEPLQLVRVEYGLAGAGQIANERVYFVWDPGWVSETGQLN